jgi:hypothetical protein
MNNLKPVSGASQQPYTDGRYVPVIHMPHGRVVQRTRRQGNNGRGRVMDMCCGGSVSMPSPHGVAHLQLLLPRMMQATRADALRPSFRGACLET